MATELKGKTAFVTGASTGIGLGIVRALAGAGASLALIARREMPLSQAAAEAQKLGSRVVTLAGDVCDRKTVATFVDRAVGALGAPDILVNNAGINTLKRGAADISLDDWDRVIAINLTGAYNLVREVLPHMKANGGGLIVNIVSIAGKSASRLAGAAYSASKFGLAGLTQSINEEEREFGIRATAIFPGEVDTPILAGRPEPVTADQLAVALQPEDIAAAVLFVAGLGPRATVTEIVIRPALTAPRRKA